MDTEAVLRQIKDRLQRTYGDRSRGVVLFGSSVRGDASEDSDIDLLVLLTGPVKFGRDLKLCIDALYPVSLELGRCISPKPVEEHRFNEYECPLFEHVKREGIRA